MILRETSADLGKQRVFLFEATALHFSSTLRVFRLALRMWLVERSPKVDALKSTLTLPGNGFVFK